MSIVGAVLILVFSEVILPDKWNKYIKVITGIIIINTIVSPLGIAWNINYSKEFEMPKSIEKESGEYSLDLIKKELKIRVDNDIKKRSFSADFFCYADKRRIFKRSNSR